MRILQCQQGNPLLPTQDLKHSCSGYSKVNGGYGAAYTQQVLQQEARSPTYEFVSAAVITSYPLRVLGLLLLTT